MLADVTVDTTADVVDTMATTIPDLMNNKGTDNMISLREAIRAANSDDAQDTIRFASTLNGGTIELTYTLDSDSSRDLDINKSLVIDASALPHGIFIDALQSSGVLDVQAAPPSHGFEINFHLINIRLTGGFTDEAGGGIRAIDADLTIEKSRISENVAVNGGGGISVDTNLAPGRTIIIKNTEISFNSTVFIQGGGLRMEGDSGETVIVIENSVFADNHADTDNNSNVGQGGGL
jgi:hypothetical protein